MRVCNAGKLSFKNFGFFGSISQNVDFEHPTSSIFKEHLTTHF